MINILTGDFLSIEEVAIYLERFGYKFDLEKQHEYRRLYSKIYDLHTQKNLTVLFHYYGKLKEEIEEVEYDKELYTGEPVRIPIYREINNIHANAYYYVDTSLLKNILINEEQVELDNYISKYDKTALTSPKQDISYYSHTNISISSRDIRIPKCDLDNLFEETVSNSTTEDTANRPDQTLLDNKRLSHAVGVGNHKILQGSPKTDKQIIEEFREQVAKLNSEKEQLKLQLDQRISTPVNDEPTHHKSVGSMQALVTTLIKMAEYDKSDLADPYGELNKFIQAKAEVLGLTVKKDFIARWLKKADDVL
ncbi:hypothetical protein [Psychrobacter sp. AOP7-B1-24]|uniref:hypothetical protein n=1 Tax=Psychrobacter sp. AOP7-B1-24 TaxID=3457645 RepID=UPI00402BF01D